MLIMSLKSIVLRGPGLLPKIIDIKDLINITSALHIYFDSHRGNVNNFGPHDPRIISIASILVIF